MASAIIILLLRKDPSQARKTLVRQMEMRLSGMTKSMKGKLPGIKVPASHNSNFPQTFNY